MCEVYNIVLAIFGLFPFLFSPAIYPFAFFLPFFFFFFMPYSFDTFPFIFSFSPIFLPLLVHNVFSFLSSLSG